MLRREDPFRDGVYKCPFAKADEQGDSPFPTKNGKMFTITDREADNLMTARGSQRVKLSGVIGHHRIDHQIM